MLCVCVGGGGGGGYSDIFIHTYGLDHFFFWFNFFFFFFFWGGGVGVRKNMNIFGGMKKLWIFLGDHHIIGLFFNFFFLGGGVFLYILGLFLKARSRMEIFFCGHKSSNIYLGMPDLRDIFNG